MTLFTLVSVLFVVEVNPIRYFLDFLEGETIKIFRQPLRAEIARRECPCTCIFWKKKPILFTCNLDVIEKNEEIN